ncbi:unnamed protein product [Rotaria socialis]|uniref:Uncharacterized protein n=1 Tax=Rotaria socialis TaxID=392032 RepID=A0A817NDJ0_9BILA|nr:unnamed protein product [Rotaria socialis]CAF3694537.1 unnamed protein product [Rotaria socialis]
MNRNIRQRQLNMKLSVLPIFTPLSTYKIYHINQSTPTILLQDLITLARKTTKFTIDTENDTPTEQKIVDQLHQSPKDINRTIYNTPTKPSVLKENQAEIHSHDVQTNDERPPLVNFLSCYVSLTQYQEDNSINIPAVNTPEDLELELQQSQKDNEILSLYNVDSYLEHKNPTNTMIIIDVP